MASKSLRIGLIPGDGIGREVIPVSITKSENFSFSHDEHRQAEESWKPLQAPSSSTFPLSTYLPGMRLSSKPATPFRIEQSRL